LTADTITVSAGTPSLYRAVACTASTLYTFSFYIKIGTLTPSDFKFAVRDDTNGVFIADNIVPNVTPVTTEWRRVTYTFTTPVGCVTVRPYLMRYGYIAGGTVFLWGAQLEAGAFPTSYIPTTTAALTRSADVCSITGSDFSGFYNASEGTMLASSSCFAPEPLALPTRRIVTASDGTTNNRVSISNVPVGFVPAGLSQVFIVATGGSIVATLGIAGLTLNSLNKLAAAYKLNDFAASTNGSAVITDTNGSLGVAINRLEIGNQINVDFLCGHIAAIRYFRKRLSNAKLQTLTS
jgi:hypothetical protein